MGCPDYKYVTQTGEVTDKNGVVGKNQKGPSGRTTTVVIFRKPGVITLVIESLNRQETGFCLLFLLLFPRTSFGFFWCMWKVGTCDFKRGKWRGWGKWWCPQNGFVILSSSELMVAPRGHSGLETFVSVLVTPPPVCLRYSIPKNIV